MSTVLKALNLDKYFVLLRKLLPGVKEISVFDPDGTAVWSDSGQNASGLEGISSGVRPFRDDETVLHLERPDQKGVLYIVQLTNAAETPVGQMSLLHAWSTEQKAHAQSMLITDALHAVSGLIKDEIGLNDELFTMAEELAERYEELNLIYGVDRCGESGETGMESLEHLVKNCTNFLGVLHTSLILPDQEIVINNFSETEEPYDVKSVLESLRSPIYHWVKKNQQAMVVNHEKELLGFGIAEKLPYKLIAAPVYSGESSVIGVLAIFKQHDQFDFTNSDRNLLDVMSKKVSKVMQSSFDFLTGLLNLQSFELSLDDALSLARKTGTDYVVMNLDLDRTRVINDVSGRQAGDELIRRVAHLIRSLVRNTDVVARLSGDKFAVLLENCSLGAAENLARKIREAVQLLPFEWDEKPHDASVCIGVAPLNAQSESVTAILGGVEAARDAAKERGSNQLKIFAQDDVDLMQRRDEIHWVGRIQSALRENRFVLYSQLIAPLNNNNHSHSEILLRMIGEDGEVLSPAAFMLSAEHFHLMPQIDRWVIKNTFSHMESQPAHVAINLSGQSLCDEGFLEFVIDQIDRLVMPASQVCFEITESAAIANLKDAKTFIGVIREKGCLFSLDDFGTGLSSFAYLKNLDVDFLKIDGSFVRNVTHDPVSRAMVDAINKVGKAMGLQTIAEYVENNEIVECLRNLGVDFGQGYGLGKPEPLVQPFIENVG